LGAWTDRIRAIRWRELVPRRSSWLCMLGWPSSYLMVMSLLATLMAKLLIIRQIDGIGPTPWVLVATIPLDLFFYFGLATLFALFERRSRSRVAVTLLIAIPATLVAAINAYYLHVTGEQLTWEAVKLGLDRWEDTWTIFAEGVIADWLRLASFVLLLAAIPIVSYVFLRRRGRMTREQRAQERARAAGPIAVLGLLLFVVIPSSDSLPVRRLAKNATLMTYWTWVTEPDLVPVGEEGTFRGSRTFEGYAPTYLVTEEAITALEQTKPSNVLVFVLESTRFDATSLAPESQRMGAHTPNLVALAESGLTSPTARSVIPHTTKSLVTILCGRYPTMQKDTFEILARFDIQCLPAIASRAGYRSAFFQSSVGAFEERPRLVSMMGFSEFFAWESIAGQTLGYLASDDESLGPAFSTWLSGLGDERFFATILTSATHHPYRLSNAIRERTKATGAPVRTDAERYQRLVEAEDKMIGDVLAALSASGHRDDTIIVVVGDHGEGFGAKGVRQHDNDFYEEGLRVPFVIHAPKLAPRVETANVSLLDVTPTVLALLGLAPAPDVAPTLAGIDLSSHSPPAARPHFFSCWFEQRCEGVIVGSQKLVTRPVTGEQYLFDLDKDPEERLARPIPTELEATLEEARAVLDAHRTGERWGLPAHPAFYGQWQCPDDRPCRNPHTGKFYGTDMPGVPAK